MKRIVLGALFAVFACCTATAQSNVRIQAQAVATCGGKSLTEGVFYPAYQDLTGTLCSTGSGGGGGGLSVVDGATFTPNVSSFTPIGGEYNATPTTLTSGDQGTVALTVNREMRTHDTDVLAAVNSPIPPQVSDVWIGNVKVQQGTSPLSLTNPLPVAGNPYPVGAVPYTNSATATTTGAVATLAGAASVTTYICGFSVRANATAATTLNLVVSGTISGSMNFTQWVAPLASGLGIAEMIFNPCVPASAANTSIVVTGAAPGAGGTNSATAWGFKL